jgi:amino acid adenylation domain-containing protein
MNAARLLEDLGRRGVVLRPDGGQLAVRAPKGVLTPEVRELLARHKEPLLALLQGRARPAASIDRAPRAWDPGSSLLSSVPSPSLGRGWGGVSGGERDGAVPLSPGQQRLWFLDQLEPGGSAYNVAITLRLFGTLDAGALGRGLAEIVARHESLRTTFAVTSGQPAQVIAPPGAAPLDLVHVDLRGRPGARDEAGRLAVLEAERPFDLSRGPLFRAALVRVGDDEHHLLLTAHHIVFDGFSTVVLVRELEALYAAYATGGPSPLPPVPLQYADFACWQRERLASGELDAELAYWRERLAGAPPALRLPADRPRPAAQTYRGARIARDLPARLVERLHARCREEGATPFMLLLATFALLLGRQAGQTDVVIGTPSAGRARRELEGLIGFFVNTLVLRVDLSKGPSFRALLARVAAAALDAYAHEEVPFERIVADLHPERHLGRTPLFQVMFNLVGFAGDEPRFAGLRAELEETMPGSRFDLTLYAIRRGDGLRLELAYNTDLFDGERMTEMLAQLEALLGPILERPEQPVGTFSLVTPDAARRLPDPTAPLPARWLGAVHDRFAERVRSDPVRPALLGRGDAWTFGALDARGNQLARLLIAGGVRPGEVVAIFGHRSAELVWALLGVLKAGAAFVILDPSHPAARLAECLRIAGPRGFIALDAAGAVPASLDELVLGHPVVARVALPAGGGATPGPWDAFPTSDPGVAVGPDDLAYVAFTSGSTGRPKGIAGTHRPLSHFVDWHARTFDLGPADRFAMLSGLSHDPLLRDVFTPLWVGAALSIPHLDDLDRLDGLASWMQAEAITVAHLTPAHGRLLDAARGAPVTAGAGRLDALRWLFFGGDTLSGGDLAALRAVAPGATAVNFYGATETPQAMGWHVAAARDAAREQVPLGRGIDGVELLVLRGGRELAGVGELGEIHVRTPYLARGYLGDPAATEARFVESPFTRDPGDRLYRTGDLGRYLPDGAVAFAGRADRQIKVRGVRVEPGEIEAALAQHPAVGAAAVTASDDGSGGTRLAAYTAPRGPGLGPSPADLRAFLRARLPEVLVPSSFTVLDALPLTANGKVDLHALPEPAEARDGDAEGAAPPRTPLEEVLAILWAGVLGVDSVGLRTSFFDLGGHSLLATRLVARIREVVGADLPVRAVFEAPTVAAFAARVEEVLGRFDPAKRPPLAPAPRGGELAASFAQQRMWFLDRLEPGEPSYRITQAVRLRGPLDAGALDRSLAEIERRHEVLRTTFAAPEGQPVQRIGPPRARVLELVDLAGGGVADPEEELRRRTAAEARVPFDLRGGPLWRCTLLRLGGGEHALLVTVHHIACDGWSMGVLRSELVALYGAFSRGRPSPLPELSIQYADHAVRERRVVAAGLLDEALAYWKARLAGVSPLELPAARAAATRAPRGAARSLRLGAPLVEALRALSRREGATLFMTLLAAFDALLHRYTGQIDLAVGTPVGGRSERALEPLIGLFVDVVVIRCDLSGDPSFRGLLGRVREAALGAYAHRDVPFERILQAIAPERDRARTPLFQVLFNMMEGGPDRFDLGDVAAELLPRPEPAARFDLTLYAIERGGGIDLTLVHDAERFVVEQAVATLDHLHELLEGVAADPDRTLSRLPLSRPARAPAPPALGAPGPGFVAFPADALGASIARRFEEQVRRAPEAIAVLTATRAMTYAELAELADRAAAALAGVIGPGRSRVGLLFEHDAFMVAGILGALAAGTPYVPLDPAIPAERLAWMARDAEVGAILTRAGGVGRAQELAPESTAVLDLDALPGGGAVERTPLAAVSPDAEAYILYTSGSTGRPKGVVQTHRNVLHHIREYTNRLHIGAGDRLSLLSTFAFDAAVMDVFGALLNGATLCTIELGRGGVARLSDRIDELGITVLHATPTVYRHFIDTLRPGQLFPSVRRVVLGGEEARRRDVEACRAHFGPECVFVNGFGPTESTLALQWFAGRETAVTRASLPLGHPVGGVEIALLDGEREQIAIYGTGEIAIRSPHVALGYWRRPDLTRAAFSEGPDPDGRGVRTYRTGDRGRLLPDGSIEFAGRGDAQVKIRGYRVEPGEIEACLLAHPRVAEAAVAAITDADGNARLAAWVVAVPGALTEGELRGFLRGALPDWMVPSTLRMIDALPLTPTGKIDRRSLRAQDLGEALPARPAAAARDPIEAEIARIWEDLLDVRPVGVHDGFFELGGHSLLAVRVIDRIERRFARGVPLAMLFDGATVEHLAAWIRGAPAIAGSARARIVPMRQGGAKDPFVCFTPPGSGASVHFARLARHLDPERPLYALEPPALGAGVATVEECAARCCAAIADAFPRGPRRLGGFSNGGVVAFEVAARLAAAGDEVTALVLLDTAAPAGVRPGGGEAMRRAQRDEDGWVLRFAGHLARVAVRDRPALGPIVIERDEIAPLSLEDKLRRLRDVAARAGAIRADTTPDELREAFERNRRDALRAAAIIAGYVPSRRAPRLTLVRAGGRGADDPALGWGPFACGPVELHVVPGDHHAILEEPAVAALADALGGCLDRAEVAGFRA